MELESLKYAWHSLEAPPAREPDQEALLALLQKKSRGPVARMRRNLVREGIIMFVTYIPAILCYWLEFEGRLSAISWLLALVALLFFGYYSRKYRLLKEMQGVTSSSIRASLAHQVETLKKYTRFYLLAGTGAIPVTYLLSYAIIRWKLPTAGTALYHRLYPAPWWASPVFWLILLVPLTIGIYYMNAWYINKLYGRHIKKLQELLQEMETE
ncbi:MAG TPA: hypothetical protein VG052_16855 [Puia sp.]|jgi:hypothetical protein|nr:hypothetical protein [Puia sp.]